MLVDAGHVGGTSDFHLRGYWRAVVRIEPDENGLPSDVFYESESQEFVAHCDGKRSVYVSAMNGPVRCKAEVSEGSSYRISLISRDEHLTGLVLVSTKPISPRTKLLAMTAEETRTLVKTEQPFIAALKKQVVADGHENGFDAADVLSKIQRERIYQERGGARFKISSPKGAIYIASIGAVPEPLGWEMRNIVFRDVGGKLRHVGDFEGCIQGFRDVDADGTSEVLVRTCDNSEGSEDIFWSLSPSIRRLVSRSE